METDTLELIITISITVILATLFLIWLYWTLPSYKAGCLDSIGVKYCVSNNMTYGDKWDITRFRCCSGDERKQGTCDYYNYLKSEQESCYSKFPHNFKWEK